MLEALQVHPQVLRARLAGDHLSAITAGVVRKREIRAIIEAAGGQALDVRRSEPSLAVSNQ